MVHLLSVHNAFHARVIAARLGSDGILTELRGPVGGPYPLPGEVAVLVEEEALATARELLLADEVESAFEEEEEQEEAQPRRVSPLPVWAAVVALFVVSLLHVVRGL